MLFEGKMCGGITTKKKGVFFSDPFSTMTPAAVGIKNPDRVKWRETIPSQEEYAGREIL